MNAQTHNLILKHIYAEPRFVAQLEWGAQFSYSAQLGRQVPRGDLETYIKTGRHPNPDRTVTLVQYEEPDWDWWEPTSEWRRKAARDRELDRLLGGTL